MTKKQIKHGAIKKYVTSMMSFFTPFNYLLHFVNFTLTLPLCYSQTSLRYCRMRKNKFFVYDCFSLSRYIREGKKSHLETRRIFRHTC